MHKPFFSVLLFCLSFVQLAAQSETPEMGSYSEKERNMISCEFDKDAEAVVLLNEASSDHDDDYHLITRYRVRIKILTDQGIDRANISIPFYSQDKFEFISNIEGLTYNWDRSSQSYETHRLAKNQIFTEKVNERFSQVKFAMPAVKAGSIIEYSYTSVMKHYGGLRDWIFQSDIPTLKSSYKLTVLPTSEFTYVVSKKDEYPIKVNPIEGTGSIYFEMNDIPGLGSEPYMDAANDYLQKVEFKLSGYRSAFGNKVSVGDSWGKIAKEMDDEPSLGGAIKKDLPETEIIRQLIKEESTQTGKLKKMYDHIQSTYTWNGINSKYTSEPLKKIVEKKTGSSGELNLVLINLLNIFDIEAYPLLVAERSFGKVEPSVPLADRFNKTAVYVIADGKAFILDVSQKYSPYYLAPYPLLNTYALIVNKKNKDLIRIKSGSHAFVSSINVSSKMDTSGIITGKVIIRNTGYAIQFYEKKIKNGVTDFFKEFPDVASQNIKIADFISTVTRGVYDTLTYEFNYSMDITDNSSYILLKTNVFAGINKNPFTKDFRFSDINFGYPELTMLNHQLELPAGVKLDLPEDKIVHTSNSDITALRNIERTGNTLNIKINLSLNTVFYSVNQYSSLKKFYKEMHLMLDEPITFKIK